jgi:hypothetical protein
MEAFALPLLGLHLLLGLGWAAAALGLLLGARADGPAARIARWAAAALAGTAALLLSAGGWWPDMPDRVLGPVLGLLGLAVLVGPDKTSGRLAILMLAGFWLALGAVSLRNAAPVSSALAVKAVLLGVSLLLAAAPAGAGHRARHALTAALLLAAGGIGALGEMPLG